MTEREEMIQALQKARRDLIAFRKIVLTVGIDDVEAAPFHQDWSDLLLHGISHVAIEGFRESAKGQYVLRAFPLYALMFPAPKRDYIVLVKNNQTLAQSKLKEIETEFLSNPILKARVKLIREQSASVFSVDVINDDDQVVNVRIEAYGKGSSVRGLANVDRRPKIVIIDDPQDNEDAASPLVMDKDWSWFISDVMFLGQHTRIFLIGNNLGEGCIVERAIAQAMTLGFETRRIGILTESGSSSWPAKFPVNKINDERESYTKIGRLDVWYRERMCLAVSDESRIFHEADYVYYTPALADRLASEAQEVFATLDPASSKGIEACFRAIVVVARMRDGHWYVLEVPYGRWDSVELLDKMFNVVLKYGVRRFGVEKGHFQQVLEPFIYKEMTRRNVRFNIQPLEHGKIGSKLERIKMLQPRFKTHSVWFPDNAYWLDEMRTELAGVTRDGIKSLFVDLVDALAMAEQMDVSMTYGVPNSNLRPVNRIAQRAITDRFAKVGA